MCTATAQLGEHGNGSEYLSSAASTISMDPGSEVEFEKEKTYFYQNDPSAPMQRVRPGLWIGDQRAERAEFAILQASSISHVLQVGTRQRRYPQCMIYKSIAAQDGLKEDLLAQAVSPKILRFIEAGCEAGGVLIHCGEGRSPAAAVVMAYLMWKEGISWLQAFDSVNNVRRVCPNAAFVLQLMRWQRIACRPEAWRWTPPTVSSIKVGQSGQHSSRVLRLTARGGRTADKHLQLDTFSVVESQYVVRSGDGIWLRRGAFPRA